MLRYSMNKKTLNESLNKVYIIKAAPSSKNRINGGYLYLPHCLVGKRIKLSVIGEPLDKNPLDICA